MQKYKAKILSIGELAEEFTKEGVMVFFASNAPDELQETAFVHDCTEAPASSLEVGDAVILDGIRFPVLAVGDVANENLANLGHLVIKFNGSNEAEMRGDVNLPAVDVPSLKPGSILEIEGRK